MLATRELAVRYFRSLVEYANGDSYLVYLAFAHCDNPSTEEKLKEFIDNNRNYKNGRTPKGNN